LLFSYKLTFVVNLYQGHTLDVGCSKNRFRLSQSDFERGF
jgi:hypothetical protein